MARPRTKDCVTITICVDMETDKEIVKFQNLERSKDAKTYWKPEAASDLFMKLVKEKIK